LPNVKIHHDFEFDPAHAMRQEAAALAHLESMQRLVGAAQGHHVNPDAGEKRGPRDTYQTSTSGPSFGHLLHHDGMPLFDKFLTSKIPSRLRIKGEIWPR
jgi:hypothetical protein